LLANSFAVAQFGSLGLMTTSLICGFASCILALNLTFCYSPQISGPQSARLSKQDVRQITALARPRNDIKKPISQLYVVTPDLVDVTGGEPEHSGDIVTGFKVEKKAGRWQIIDSSVHAAKAFVSVHEISRIPQ
jgi:hypothetical protein